MVVAIRTAPPPHTSEELRSGPAGAHGSAGHSQFEIGLSFCFCVLVAISPRRAKLGGVLPRGMRSADAPPPIPTAGAPRPAGGHVAGAGLTVCPPVASGI
jgi:hypothetical protein